ncbi:methyltransferase domain-containing protein [Laspinema palackyanum]|uniref:methyltransferase domain-containing protein n=1 Tax=Laspinema palackyanum TaxID=3231601 RepID=UPI00345CCC85|nr:class I SAM-dependent methyltransferase [Laspinema sp. D2c]
MKPLTKYVPWWAKIGGKVILSRLPTSYHLWKNFSLFEHGSMQDPAYAYSVFKQHFDRIQPPAGFTSLELGPGDSLFSAIVTKAFGGSSSYLVDTGDYATQDIDSYKIMAEFLDQKELAVDSTWTNWQSVSDILESCSAHYLTSGLSSLKSIPDNSVDFIWSQAVLEHIRKHEFLVLMQELRRIIKNTGSCSHVIDLKDHLGGNLNSLRFPEKIWESDFMVKSGFYTNRIRYSEMIDLFQEANFQITSVEIKKWDKLPTSRANLALPFKNMPDEELLVSEFSTILQPV